MTWLPTTPIAAIRTGLWFAGRLHVRPVALAQGKAHAELRVELCEFVQANEFVVCPGARAHVESNAVLMPRGALLDDSPDLDDARSPGARAFLALANASLLLGSAMGRCDGYVACSSTA